MRPPTAASWRCILAWMALSVATSNMPRPSPGWLDATTTCQPARLSRAMASSAPGRATQSSGEATYSSLPRALIVPSRFRMTIFMEALSKIRRRRVPGLPARDVEPPESPMRPVQQDALARLPTGGLGVVDHPLLHRTEPVHAQHQLGTALRMQARWPWTAAQHLRLHGG